MTIKGPIGHESLLDEFGNVDSNGQLTTYCRRGASTRRQKTTHAEIESAGPLSPPLANVMVKLFNYQPERIQVNAGTTVTWVNEDEIFHTVTAENNGGGFDAPLDGKGKSFSFTFSQPGLYSYYCDRHEQMRGEVEVF